MISAPTTGIDPFAVRVRGVVELDPVHAALRAAGPMVCADAPAGGPVWIITQDALARAVLADPRIVKDPAFAPVGWDPRTAGLEQTAAEQVSLTTVDGPAHAELRRAHVPLFTARRMLGYGPRVTQIAREHLGALADTAGPVDLMADFTTRFPLTVLCDLLGVPLDRVDDAAAACRAMFGPDPAEQGRAIGALMELAAAALPDDPDRGGASGSAAPGLAAELRDQVPDGITGSDLLYLLFGIIFAGQLTTDAALGFLLAHAIGGQLDPASIRSDTNGSAADDSDTDGFVREMLRRHPPAPFSLWRFTSTDVELAGVRLPARSPVLVDIAGINNDPDRSDGPDLSFGAGPHFCIGAQLAQLELRAAVQVLLADYPEARLEVPFADLRCVNFGGIQGSRLTALPVILRP